MWTRISRGCRNPFAFTRGQDHRLVAELRFNSFFFFYLDEMTLQRREAAMVSVRIQNGTDLFLRMDKAVFRPGSVRKIFAF